MPSSKLLDLLKSLSAVEMRQLESFAQSPFFNTRDDVRQLLRLLKGVHPNFSEAELNREHIHKQLYPGQPFRDLWMRQLSSIVMKLVEQFLLARSLQANPVEADVWLMRAYRERGLEKHFNGTLRRARQLQDAEALRDMSFFYRQYLIEAEAEQMREQSQGRSPDNNLQAMGNNLDVFYITRKLKLAAQMTTYQNIFGTPYEQQLVPELLQHLDRTSPDLPLLQLYHNALLTLTEADGDPYFYKLKSLLENHRDVLPPTETASLHTAARNYAIRQSNQREWI